jgi:hypothetical protein
VGVVEGINHVLNFVAPAFFMALAMVLCARLFVKKSGVALAWWAQAAINFAVGCAVLFAGLVLFGRDGKMATYAALVLSCTSCQWVLSKAWR